MRHNKAINHLGRKSGHRKALLANMATTLILNKRIQTTVAKAKALRIFFEPIVTKAKVDNTANRREAFAKLRDKEAVKELFHDVITKVGDRQGGYTRILKTGFRLGDAAQMCFIELVDFNENYSSNKTASAAAEPKKKATRRSRAKKAAETVEAEAAPAAEVVEEAKAE